MIEKDRKTQQAPLFTDTYDIADARFIACTQRLDIEVIFLFRIQSGWNPADYCLNLQRSQALTYNTSALRWGLIVCAYYNGSSIR
jgi:hypothetical protein